MHCINGPASYMRECVHGGSIHVSLVPHSNGNARAGTKSRSLDKALQLCRAVSSAVVLAAAVLEAPTVLHTDFFQEHVEGTLEAGRVDVSRVRKEVKAMPTPSYLDDGNLNANVVPSGRSPRTVLRGGRAQRSRASAMQLESVQDNLHKSAGHTLTQEEEQAYCRILQEAKQLHAHRVKLHRNLGKPPSVEQIAASAELPDPSYVSFIFQAAPQVRKQLVLGFKAYIASQGRQLLGNKTLYTYSQSGWRDGPGGTSLNGVVQMDDIFLSGVQGLIQAAYRFNAAAEASDGSSSRTGGIRLMTFAHFYIRKHMMAAIKENSYNQVFIPRRTLDIKHSVETTMAKLRSEKGREPGARAVAKRLGITEEAVRGVLEVQRTRVVGFAAGGSDSSPYEDVQLVKEMDRIQSDVVSPSGGSPVDAANLVSSGQADGGRSTDSGGDSSSGRMDAEAMAAREVALQQLDVLLKSVMSEREAWVLNKSMGLGREGGEGITTYVLAEELGVCRQRVDAIKKKALSRLRKACESNAELAQAFEEVVAELS